MAEEGDGSATPVTYPLWPRTAEALRRFGRAEGALLRTPSGRPINADNLRHHWNRLMRALVEHGAVRESDRAGRNASKTLRKAGAQLVKVRGGSELSRIYRQEKLAGLAANYEFDDSGPLVQVLRAVGECLGRCGVLDGDVERARRVAPATKTLADYLRTREEGEEGEAGEDVAEGSEAGAGRTPPC